MIFCSNELFPNDQLYQRLISIKVQLTCSLRPETNKLINKVNNDVHKEAKSQAMSFLNDITNVKAFIHPQLPAQKDH